MDTVTTGGAAGVVSYLDTPEIAGFLASHPEFRPAPLADIAALYYQAWNYLLHDYRSDAHLLSIFAFGRGNYAYISREREWQQTTGFFRQACKLAHAVDERVGEGRCRDVSGCPCCVMWRGLSFLENRRSDRRAFGWWQGALRFALPITTGPKPGVGLLAGAAWLAGFRRAEIYPVLTPYVELADGRTVVATDGADVIEPSADGLSLRVRWNKWAVVGRRRGRCRMLGW